MIPAEPKRYSFSGVFRGLCEMVAAKDYDTLRQHAVSKDRDSRQQHVAEWVVRCFGQCCLSPKERLARLIEETAELAQAEGMVVEEIKKIVKHVYGKPPGDPRQEAAGIGVTLLAYCAARGFSADEVEQAEVDRITSLPPEHFKQRQNAKADAGIGLHAL